MIEIVDILKEVYGEPVFDEKFGNVVYRSTPRMQPCPFCGGEAVVKYGEVKDGGTHHKRIFVGCMKCGCRTPGKICAIKQETSAEDEQAAIWNRRIGE